MTLRPVGCAGRSRDPGNISSDSNCVYSKEYYLHASRGDLAALVEELRD